MSNVVIVSISKFVDVDVNGEELDTSWNLRISDSYGSESGSFDKEALIGASPLQLVTMIEDFLNDEARETLKFARDTQDGLEIAGKHYTWAEIGTRPEQTP